MTLDTVITQAEQVASLVGTVGALAASVLKQLDDVVVPDELFEKTEAVKAKLELAIDAQFGIDAQERAALDMAVPKK